MVSLKRNRSRIKVETKNPLEEFSDVIINGAPAFWRGAAWQLEFGIFNGDEIVNVADFDSITCEVRDYTERTSNLLMAQTIPVVELNANLAASEWTARTAQHGIFEFTGAETNLDMKGKNQRELWLVLSALVDETSEQITLGGGKLIICEDGSLIDQRAIPPLGASMIPLNQTYSGAGQYVAAVVAGRNYRWTKGANDTSLTNGTETIVASGTFIAQGVSVTLNGTASALITATLRHPDYLSSEESDARYLRNVAKVIKPKGQLEIFHSENGLWRRVTGVSNEGLPIDHVEPTPV
ncbi:MAG TPA: hypothetical protein VF773_10920 [Verrucomicrobiae bacterium]